MRYQLRRADFDMGQTVYENDAKLSHIEGTLYKITSDDGEKTFRVRDFVTLVGTMVEFETFDHDLTVRCELEDLMDVRHLYNQIKLDNSNPEVIFNLLTALRRYESQFFTGIRYYRSHSRWSRQR